MADQQSISIVTTGQIVLNGNDREVNARFLREWQTQALAAYKDSALFSQVSSGWETTDLRAEVRIVDNGSFNPALAFLTGLSFYLIQTPRRTS